MLDLLGIAFRIGFMYVFALVLLRLSGKRSIGQLTALDFVIAGVLGDLFDDAVFASLPLSTVVVAFAVIFILHLLVATAGRQPRLAAVLNGTPATVITDGRLLPAALRRERLHPNTVMEELRERGIDQLAEVQQGRLELSGHISAIKRPEARPLERRDLARPAPRD